MKRKYPVIDLAGTGRNMKRIMQMKGMTVKDMQIFLKLSTPQSIYHWFEGRNLPTIDNLYALSELFQMPVDALLKGDRKYEYGWTKDRGYQRILRYYERFRELQEG